MSPFLGGYCTKLQLILTYIFIIVTLILIFTAIPALYRFATKFKSSAENASNSLFVAGIVFMLTIIITLIGIAFGWRATYCYASDNDAPLWVLFVVGYPIQWYLLLTILFHRLYRVFEDTALNLSTCTVRVYQCIFVLLVVYSILIAFYGIIVSMRDMDAIWMLNVSACLAVAIMVSISISVLFVRKLIKTYVEVDAISDVNEQLFAAIKRNTILSVVSTLTSIAPIVFVILDYAFVVNIRSYSNESDVFRTVFKFVRDCAWLMDVYTNLLCMILSYSLFHGTYSKLCGWFDRMYTRQHKKVPSQLVLTRNVSDSAS